MENGSTAIQWVDFAFGGRTVGQTPEAAESRKQAPLIALSQ